MPVRFMVVSSDDCNNTRRFMPHVTLYARQYVATRHARSGKEKMFITILSCMLAAMAISFTAYAQTNKRSATTSAANEAISSLTSVDSAASITAWAKADTGRMMPGYRDLSAYDTPGYCLAAMKGMERLTWRRGESDTLPKKTVFDTVPENVRDVGRACIAKMTPRTVPSVELYNLARLALQIGDTALARQTVEYHLSITSDNARERGYVLGDAIYEATIARPLPLSFVESLLSRFSELGKEAVAAHSWAIALAQSVAHDRFDTTKMLRYSAERDSMLRTLTAEERKEQELNLGGVFSDSLEIVWYQLVPNLAPTIKQLGEQWASAGGFENTDFSRAIISMATAIGEIAGQQAPTLNVFRRYPDDAPLTPIPGRVTLVMSINRIGKGRLDKALAYIRRLHDRYHDRGFDVVLIGRTVGYAWGSPPLAAEAEAKLFGWYYHEYLNLPFPVLVEETSFNKKPDGRKVAAPTSFQEIYRPLQVGAYIVGRDGLVKSINYGMHTESELEAYLLRELAAQVQKAQ